MGRPPQLAQCPRCASYTLVGTATGITVAVDIAPLLAQGLANAVVHRVGLWWVEEGPDGRPGRLKPPGAAPRPSWGPNGSQTGTQRLHAEHSCGALAKDMRIVQPPGAQQGPPSAPVTPGSPRGGHRPPDAPAGATGGRERPSRAQPATHLRSRPVRCATCDRIIAEGEPYTGIQCGTYAWANHEECP
jgi:hypothetical protein